MTDPDTSYVVSEAQKQAFVRDGYVHLPGVLSEAELEQIEVTYHKFLAREIDVPGRDFCDMSGDYERSLEEFSIVHVMLPRVYYPPLQGNLYELRAASIAEQLCGPEMDVGL